ncbi:MAG TPA: hypothetical protein VG077_04700 [Verrucomicrobiae bacterium]|nr:hypothetical protein [Verrucomicrobiae bacterium]
MRREWTIYLALLLITAAAYWPVGQYGYFNYDDPEYVATNPYIGQGLTPAGVAWAFRAVVVSNWHPMTLLSLMLDSQLFGNNAGAHHLVNLLFHVANTLLLFLVWRRMTGEVWPSALVAALFAWHPLHVESVAWISERKDVLCTFFGLLTIWAYTRFVQRSELGNRISDFRLPTSGHYWLALFFFALGLMSKPMLVTWPFVLLLLDFWPLGRVASDKWRVTRMRIPVPQLSVLNHLVPEKLPFFALAMASSVITFLAQHASGATNLLVQLPLSESAGNALVSCVRYLGKMVWPDRLAFFYPYPGRGIVDSNGWAVWQVAGAAALLALITMAAAWQGRRRPFLIAGWLWFLGTLVPVIGLVQVGAQAMADRYTYIPLIGVFVMLAWSGKELGDRRPGAKFIFGLSAAGLLAACLMVTSRQLRYWQNSETLCRHAIAVTKNNYLAHFNLGLALIDEGKIDAAVKQMYEAVNIAPGFGGRKKLAQVLVVQGRIPEAIVQYRIRLQYNPNDLDALKYLAWWLATDADPKIRNGAEAVQFAERACRLTHYQKTEYLGILAAAYAEAGRFNDAIPTAERAIASAQAAGETSLLEKNRQLLELYRAGQPYHEITK